MERNNHESDLGIIPFTTMVIPGQEQLKKRYPRKVGVFIAVREIPQISGGKGETVFGMLIRRIRMFLGLPDPHPDPLATSSDPDPSLFP
jgi:hypothetical protein